MLYTQVERVALTAELVLDIPLFNFLKQMSKLRPGTSVTKFLMGPLHFHRILLELPWVTGGVPSTAGMEAKSPDTFQHLGHMLTNFLLGLESDEWGCNDTRAVNQQP